MDLTNCMWCNSTNLESMNNAKNGWPSQDWCKGCGMIQDERCFIHMGDLRYD